MTEADWLACTDSTPMLELLRHKGSARKLRLFTVACCRSVWQLLTHEGSRTVVEVLERNADELASEQDIRFALSITEQKPDDSDLAAMAVFFASSSLEPSTVEATDPSEPIDWTVASTTSDYAEEAIYRSDLSNGDWHSTTRRGMQIQSRFIHDIFGNPFRLAFVDSAWRSWNDGTVVHLAQSIYEERAFDRFPILADALEEAGCANADMLSHVRSPGPHVRGCWLLDLLLGKS